MIPRKKTSPGLRPLPRWQARLVPAVLLIVAWNTYLRDRFFSRFLPRRVYETFVFEPRSPSAKTSSTPKTDTHHRAG